MQWSEIFPTIISSLVSTAGLGGAFTAIFLRKENKRAKQLENIAASNTQWQKLVDELQAERTELQAKINMKEEKIDNLYMTIDKLRQDQYSASQHLIKADILKCIRIECKDRKPPMEPDNETK